MLHFNQCTKWDSQNIHAADIKRLDGVRDIEMATLEKLVRTVEALKLHQTPSVTVDETMAKKDKIAHCVSVTDMICSQVDSIDCCES